MLQAFQGGAIDTGFVGSTPLIFAQAAGQDIVAVAGWAAEHGSYGLLTARATTTSRAGRTSKGKQVAYQQGTAGEAALLQALDDGGRRPSTDITHGRRPADPDQRRAAERVGRRRHLDRAADQRVPRGRTRPRRMVDRRPRDHRPLVVPDRVERRPSTTRARRPRSPTTSRRLVRSFTLPAATHPGRSSPTRSTSKQYGLTPERADGDRRGSNGTTAFFSLPGDIARASSRSLADLFVAAGQIPDEDRRRPASSTPGSTTSSRSRGDVMTITDAPAAPHRRGRSTAPARPTRRRPTRRPARRPSGIPPRRRAAARRRRALRALGARRAGRLAQPQRSSPARRPCSPPASTCSATAPSGRRSGPRCSGSSGGSAIGMPDRHRASRWSPGCPGGRRPGRRQHADAAVRPDHRAAAAAHRVARRRRDREDQPDRARRRLPGLRQHLRGRSDRSTPATSSWPTSSA